MGCASVPLDASASLGLVGVFGANAKLTSPSRTVLLAEMNEDSANNVTDSEFGGPDQPDFVHTFPSGASGLEDVGNVAGQIRNWLTIGSVRSAALGTMVTGPMNNIAMSTWLTNLTAAQQKPWFQNGVHTSGSNFLCADGHVKWLTSTNVSYGFIAVGSNDAQGIDTGHLNAEGTQNGTHALTFSAT